MCAAIINFCRFTQVNRHFQWMDCERGIFISDLIIALSSCRERVLGVIFIISCISEAVAGDFDLPASDQVENTCQVERIFG